MDLLNRKIIGGITILLGLALIITSFYLSYYSLIYAIPIFIIGLIIFLNKKEDEIEKIKNERR